MSYESGSYEPETGPTETRQAAPTAETAGFSNPGGERAGFCQDCGRPLTREALRQVGSGVFCEPCLQTRLGTNPTSAAYGPGSTTVYGAATGTTLPPPGYVPPIAPAPGDPSPILAGCLGLIPGVGAMYNGQFAKGIVHLIIFAVLVSLANNVSSLFGIFVAGWIFYQAFEAYHTARARLEGLPLPNAFGFNDIGERMGFGKNWPISPARPNPVPPPVVPVTPWTTQPTQPTQPPCAATPTPPQVPPAQAFWAPPPQAANPFPAAPPAPNWVGYVPPTEFGHAAAYDAARASAAREQAYRDAGVGHPPYAQTYTGPSTADFAAGTSLPTRRFPSGAIWLIGLGVLFLLANIDSGFRIRGSWLVAAILAAVSIWSFTRRMDWIAGAQGVQEHSARILSVVRGPAMVMLLAILFALQAAHVWSLGQTWPALIIGGGVLLLLERSIGRVGISQPAAPSFSPSFVPATPHTPGSSSQAADTAPVAPAARESAAPEPAAWPASDEPETGGQR